MGGLPAGFDNARQLAFVGKFTQAQAAKAKQTVVTTGATTHLATISQLHRRQFTLRSLAGALLFFHYHAGFGQGSVSCVGFLELLRN